MLRLLLLAGAASLAACSPPSTDAPEAPAPAESAPAPEATPETDAEAPPGTDIHLFQLAWSDGLPQLGAALPGIERPGYDNQPFFEYSGDTLLYTADDETGETDIWRLDLASGASAPVRRTPDESEYSPRTTPNGSEISYIYQPPGGYAGNVYLARLDNSGRYAAETLAPVGYYAFSGDMRHVAVFALGEPNTLQLIDREQTPETPVHIADEPGRSLFTSPRGNALYFTLADEAGRHHVQALNFATGETSEMFELPEGTQDFAIALMPNDSVGFFAVDGARLLYRGGDSWTEAGDLAAAGLTGITRLAVSPDLTRIAIVAEE